MILPGEAMTAYDMKCAEMVQEVFALPDLSSVFGLEILDIKDPVFRDLTSDTLRQLESGIYSYGRRKKIDVKEYHEDGTWHYKDWGLKEIIIPQMYFDYLNMPWIYIDLRPNKNLDYWCNETFVFDKLCIVIQELHQDSIFIKILVKEDDEELMLYIEDVLQFKPHMIVPDREIREINELEAHGVKFNSTPEALDKKTKLVISNLDHYDNYLYEVYDTKRNSFKHLSKEKERRCAESQIMWLESWIDRKEINNDIQALLPYLTDKNIEVIERYTYQNSDENGRFFDRQSCGGYLFDDVKYKVFNFDTFEEEIRKGKRMDRIAMELDIPISAAWDIWKMLNMKKMRKILDELYEEFPAFEL